jgi:threonine dehydratase
MKNNIKNIISAREVLSQIIKKPTPLEYSVRLSEMYGADIYLKREDLTMVRSFKIRGAYYKISQIVTSGTVDKHLEIICASAGNHAQGVAYACAKLSVRCVIYMPTTTPNQKVKKVKYFGGRYVEVRLFGNTFDESKDESIKYCDKTGGIYVHPFDDDDVIAGQATVASEILEQFNELKSHDSKTVDFVLVAVGGGGLISGVSSYLSVKSPKTSLIGVESELADSMNQAVISGKPVMLDKFDTFVDGASVRITSARTLDIVCELVRQIVVVSNGEVCTSMIDLYQNEGIISEPAGALSVAGLNHIKDQIKGKTIVCVISGGNNDLLRYPEILERSLVHQGKKHYFIIEFAQKPGQLRNFLAKALAPTDDIVRFEYMKRNNREKGPALVGIELANRDDYNGLIDRMDKIGITYRKILPDDLYNQYLV